MNPASAFYAHEPEWVLLALTARGLVDTTDVPDSEAAQLRSASFEAQLQQLWSTIRERLPAATIVQQTFLDVYPAVFGNLDAAIAGAPHALVGRANAYLHRAATTEGLQLLDVARAAARDGLDAWYEEVRWLHGKMELSPKAAPRYAGLFGRLLSAAKGKARKCLVLDLDNTLWHGVIGDDGLDGIVLGEGSALGEAHLALQRYAKQLSRRGVILAVCSKNERAAAESPFREHPEMLLTLDDIAVFVANWEDKARNIERIAAELNIGLDSLVFMDDNPAERARVRESLPQVAVPELPDDPAQYVATLASFGFFESVAFTTDDRQRTAQYRSNAARRELESTAGNLEEFLTGLSMSSTFGPIQSVDVARVAQLFGKTNQFNTTTIRYGREEVVAFTENSACLALQFRLKDRFGDNGLVSALIVEPDEAAGSYVISNWIMSCRVFGRSLEQLILNVLVELLCDRGVECLRAPFRPTEKNGVVADLYERLGFAEESRDESGHSTWLLTLADFEPLPCHIVRDASEAAASGGNGLAT